MQEVNFSELFESTRTGNGWVVTTPFLDPRNDHITLYVEELPSGLVRVTDTGDTVWDVEITIPGFGPGRSEWAWVFKEACSHISTIRVDEDGCVTTDVEPGEVAATVAWVAQACLQIYQLVAVEHHRQQQMENERSSS